MSRSRLFQSQDSTSESDLEQEMSESGEINPAIQSLIGNLNKLIEVIERSEFGEDEPDFSDKSLDEIKSILIEMENEFRRRIDENKKINGETIPDELAVFIEKNRRILASARQEIESRVSADENKCSAPTFKK